MEFELASQHRAICGFKINVLEKTNVYTIIWSRETQIALQQLSRSSKKVPSYVAAISAYISLQNNSASIVQMNLAAIAVFLVVWK